MDSNVNNLGQTYGTTEMVLISPTIELATKKRKIIIKEMIIFSWEGLALLKHNRRG